jgi:hypothetical protein
MGRLPGEFARVIHSDFEKWSRVVKAAAIKAD